MILYIYIHSHFIYLGMYVYRRIAWENLLIGHSCQATPLSCSPHPPPSVLRIVGPCQCQGQTICRSVGRTSQKQVRVAPCASQCLRPHMQNEALQQLLPRVLEQLRECSANLDVRRGQALEQVCQSIRFSCSRDSLRSLYTRTG